MASKKDHRRHVEELDLLIERQIRTANDPRQDTPLFEAEPGWPIVAGWEPPPAWEDETEMPDAS